VILCGEVYGLRRHECFPFNEIDRGEYRRLGCGGAVRAT